MKLNLKNEQIEFGTNILNLEIPSKLKERYPCGIKFIDDAYGGEGFTPSTISLFTGEPGAGKTTLMLMLANALTESGHLCVFNTAEESLHQVRLTCERLGLSHGFIAGQDTNINTILSNCDNLREKNPYMQLFLIIDSLQTLQLSDNDTANSTIKILQMLTDYAKSHYINIIVIGQVNKSGSMAGSQKLKHMVDAMLHLSIEDKDKDFMGCRVLQTIKNRFGGSGWTFFLDLKRRGFREVARIGVE